MLGILEQGVHLHPLQPLYSDPWASWWRCCLGHSNKQCDSDDDDDDSLATPTVYEQKQKMTTVTDTKQSRRTLTVGGGQSSGVSRPADSG